MSILRIDMSNCKSAKVDLPVEKIIGGRAMIDYLLTEYGNPRNHPLSKEAMLIVATGLLSGSSAPQSGRLSIGGKSPLTGGIKEANAGGTAGHKLARLGIKALMIEGKSEKPLIMRLNTEGISFEDAGDILGVGNYEACKRLRSRYGNHIGIIIAGVAGEMRLANSTIAVTDPEGRPARQAARGGLGAVMASKGLKAIVVDDSGTSVRKPADPARFSAGVKGAIEAIKAHPFTKPFHQYGTNFALNGDNDRGSLPTCNHRFGSFDKYENINAQALFETIKSREGKLGHGCMPGCVVRCSSIYNDPEGKFLTASFDYETIAMLGSNLGIADLDAIAWMDRQCDELGVDTIELGCTIGLLGETELFEFGDIKGAHSLIEEIAKGSPLGRVIGSGVAITGKVFGIDRVPAIKGQGIPGHSARSCKGWGVTYATSPQGADHTAGPVLGEFLSSEGQVQRSRMSQIAMLGLDSTGLCMFSRLMQNPEIVVEMINGCCGLDWGVEDYLQMAKKALRQERAFNQNAGISSSEDRVPEWMRKEPLPPTNATFDVPEEEMDQIFNF